jgi:hypothetical protein
MRSSNSKQSTRRRHRVDRKKETGWAVLIVAGLSLKNLQPRVWDPASPFHIPELHAVMVSYADFHKMQARRTKAMEVGLRAYLGVPKKVKVFLDNGAFYFAGQEGGAPLEEYEKFVEKANPDWRPIPQDYIPSPSMPGEVQRSCFDRTMMVNRQYQDNGYVPVVHIGAHLKDFTACITTDQKLSKKDCIALGGIVPNLLRKPKAMPYDDILKGLRHVRQAFADKSIHVFGVGGTATLHITALLGFDSVDSSGWRNRAARGIVQLPGSGERMVAELGKWRGRRPDEEEWKILGKCKCPACGKNKVEGLKASGLHGFCCRATHNLWVLLDENRWLVKHIPAKTYRRNYPNRLDNSIYRPIIKDLLKMLKADEEGPTIGQSRRLLKRKEK